MPVLSPLPQPGRNLGRVSGFSLVEVVAALGIFSVGIVVVLRLFTGIVDSVRHAEEAETGIRAAEALLGQLRARPFDEVANCLMTAEELQRLESSSGNGILPDRRLFFANAAAAQVGQGADPIWRGRERERFFELALVRDEALSPRSADSEASRLVFTVRVRWPASSRVGAQVAVLSGSILRTP
jgi:hypothetical protein